MTLSLTSPIKAADIAGVKVYKEGKVFLVQGIDGSEVVVKYDAPGLDQVKATTLAVKAIDPAARMKVLSTGELHELERWCEDIADLEAFYAQLVKEGMIKSSPFSKNRDAASDLHATIKEAKKYNSFLAKMNKMTVHNIEDAVEERGKGGKDLLRAFAKGLKDDGGLEMFGKVMAADMFNQNFDRFNPEPPPKAVTKTIGPFNFTFRALVNVSNILMQDTGTMFKATVLDYADPQRGFSHPGIKLANISSDWGGSFIVDKKKRKKFAEDIVYDLEQLLNPKKSKFSLKTKLGRDAAKRIEAGMILGCREICSYLEARLKQKGALAPGFMDRYNEYRKVTA